MWRSPVARAVRVGEAVGSNPSIPTQKTAGKIQRFCHYEIGTESFQKDSVPILL